MLILLVLMLKFTHSAFSQTREEEFILFVDSLCNHNTPLISADSLKALKDVVLLDAREKEEFDVSHLRAAKSVGYFWFDMRNVYNIHKDATIVVYCSIGNRSEKIANKLLKFGYKNVYTLYGGIFNWVNAGYPIFRKDGVQTTEIHTYDAKWASWVAKGAKVY
ncbi:rhodanese-like domain-containing protein [Pseudoxanthomonas sp. SGD-10]|nr:rhodanese-like domain-containing protein [Pseudoxanthomonas sp. SGD-10]